MSIKKRIVIAVISISVIYIFPPQSVEACKTDETTRHESVLDKSQDRNFGNP